MTLVSGYIPQLDYPDDSAVRHSLPHRFAVVVLTLGHDGDDTEDEVFFLRLLDQLLRCIAHDAIEIIMDSHLKFASWGEFSKQYVQTPEGDRNLFQEATLLRQGMAVALVKTQPYFMIGGPMPYHDSTTFEFFFNEKEYEACLRESCLTVAEQPQTEFQEEIHGLPAPEISRWTRVRNFLKRHL
jgi:hypothetical protein